MASQSIPWITVMSGAHAGAEPCLVCGKPVEAGDGFVARVGERMVRLRCDGCVTRFLTEPARFLAGHPTSCCDEEPESAASEWRA